ncbi:MAG: hypothetical protein M3Y93_00010 [Pseudomonadota bacterium]|nr:hypothetical protein [Pseudomonadota bacterium]
MSDTIELLTNIRSDASLRHASSEKLASVLEQKGASDTLKAAVAAAAGDSCLLVKELGNQPRCEPQIIHSPGHDEEPDHDVDEIPAEPVPGRTELPTAQ